MRSRTLLRLVAAMLVAASAGSVHAGSPDDPEVADDVGDGGPGGRDIAAAWFSMPDPGNVTVHIQLGAEYSVPTTRLLAEHTRIAVFFKPTAGMPDGSVECYVSFLRGYTADTSAEPGNSARFACNDEAGAFGTVAEEDKSASAVFAGDAVNLTFPLEYLPGFVAGTDALREPYGLVVEQSKGPVTSPDVVNQRLHEWDRAPDSGFGRDFSTVGLFDPPVPSMEVSADPSSVDLPTHGSVDSVIRVTNTGATDLDLKLAVRAPAGVPASLFQEVLFVGIGTNATVNLTLEAGAGTPKEGVVSVDVSGNGLNATADVAFSFADAVEPSTSPSPTGTPGEDNGTAAGDDGGRSPAPGLAIAVGACLAAGVWASRRRR